ncbi:MAG: 50S ribosomal protein L29 [Bacteroidales bacterium]
MKTEFVIKELSTPELKDRLSVEQVELNKLKLNHAISPVENPNLIKVHKKTIARILTELRRRELAE